MSGVLSMSVDMLSELVPELKAINRMLEGLDLPTVPNVEFDAHHAQNAPTEGNDGIKHD